MHPMFEKSRDPMARLKCNGDRRLEGAPKEEKIHFMRPSNVFFRATNPVIINAFGAENHITYIVNFCVGARVRFAPICRL